MADSQKESKHIYLRVTEDDYKFILTLIDRWEKNKERSREYIRKKIGAVRENKRGQYKPQLEVIQKDLGEHKEGIKT